MPPASDTVSVAFGLGASCLPGARERLTGCIAALCAVLERAVAAPIVRSAPLGPAEQPDYLNTVVIGATQLTPEVLLAFGKRLELVAGRRPGRRWGPRPLDVDLLWWGGELRGTPELRLPHPELWQRAFVLGPLAQLASAHPHPITTAAGPALAALASSGLAIAGGR